MALLNIVCQSWLRESRDRLDPSSRVFDRFLLFIVLLFHVQLAETEAAPTTIQTRSVFAIRQVRSCIASEGKAALSADAGFGFDRSDPSTDHAAFQRLENTFQLRRIFDNHGSCFVLPQLRYLVQDSLACAFFPPS